MTGPAPTRRKPTIQDVADACGLAPSTISNALAGKAIVRPETMDLVRRTAAELGYRVSPMARALRMGKTWSVGMIVSDITNPFHGEVFRGAEEVLSASGYQLLLSNTDFDSEKQSFHVEHFIDRRVDAVILLSASPESRDIERLSQAGIPTVLLMRRHVDMVEHGLDYCGIENARGMRLGLNHLLELGHRRIGFINGPASSSNATERLDAYRAFTEANSGVVDPILIEDGPYSIAAGRAASARMLSAKDPPTAIVCAQDLIALGVLSTAAEMKLRVPQDLSLIGWDDLFVVGVPQIDLTTMRIPKWELGSTAARLILRRIADPQAAAQQIEVRPELVVRGTTSPLLRHEASGLLSASHISA